MVATRLACASSLCISRYCRSRRVLSKAMVACAAKSLNKEICLSVNGCTCLRPRATCGAVEDGVEDGLQVVRRARNGARHFRDGRLLLDELGHPILRLRSGPFSVDTLVHAEQFLGLDGEGSIAVPAAARDSSGVNRVISTFVACPVRRNSGHSANAR